MTSAMVLAIADLSYSGDEDMLELLRRMLARARLGIDLQSVPALKAVQTVKRLAPALVIAGHRPLSPKSADVLWGSDIIKALKTDPQTCRVPVLLIESLANIDLVAQMCGADACLLLPLRPTEFIDTVRRLLQAQENKAESSF